MRKIVYLMVFLSVVLLSGCNNPYDTVQKKTYENDKEAFNTNSNNNMEKTTDVSGVAKKGDTVYVNYTGKTEDGKIFDTSLEDVSKEAGTYAPERTYEPLSFTLGAGQMIAGFDTGVEGMKVGEKKTITIAPEDAYGTYDDTKKTDLGKGASLFQGSTISEITEEGITIDFNHELAGKSLVFEITMVESDSYPVTTGSQVKVDYVGTLLDGTEFDSSKKPGRTPLPFTVGAGQMIKGFDNAVMGMNQGDSKTVTLEPSDAYGELREDQLFKIKIGEPIGQLGVLQSTDPENETFVLDQNHFLAGKTLIFDIELVKID